MPLHVKNSMDVRVAQRGEECVGKVPCGSSGTPNGFTNIFLLLSAEPNVAKMTDGKELKPELSF